MRAAASRERPEPSPARITRRAAVLALPACAALAQPRWAPTREVRLLTGFPPGGTTDIVARLLAEALRPRLPQPVVVDPRPGANGFVAAAAALRAPPDGHALFLAQLGILSIGPALPGTSPPEGIEALLPLGAVAGTPMVLVARPGAPFTNLDGLLAAARAKPGGLTYGSAGIGSVNHLAMERFARVAGVSLLHVPYRGGAAAALDLQAGRVDAMMANLAESLAPLAERRISPLALAGEAPSAVLPDVPLLRDRFPDLSVLNWFGVFAPPGLDDAVRATWSALVSDAMASPGVRSAFVSRALEPLDEDGDTLGHRVRAERAIWARLALEAGIRAE